MWQAFIQWFTEVINLTYSFTVQIGMPSYGLAIIFMTIIIKLVMFPLTQKQMKSMRAMQEIQPKAKWIQEKYKDDQQVLQQKTMELYKEHGVNPMGGCLPLLIQMPIFIAFYQSLYKFQYLDVAHKGFLWINDIALLVKNDPDLTKFILPLLAALTTYYQQRISTTQNTDPTQRAMLYFMPLMMAYISYTVPAGLGLYWVTFNILGILQQSYVNYTHRMGKLDTGVGVQVDYMPEPAPMQGEPETYKGEEPQKDKGGGGKDARPNNRKKRKKR
ncbi:MAG: YidC/Oxa1 family membrane protein insertase [Syntrophomonadaceae bacterium]